MLAYCALNCTKRIHRKIVFLLRTSRHALSVAPLQIAASHSNFKLTHHPIFVFRWNDWRVCG